MTPLEQLASIMNERYISEDEDEYKVELMAGLSDQEIDRFKDRLSSKRIPDEIKELLKFAGGFGFYGLDYVTFGLNEFSGFEEIFPFSIELASDGFGNFWILDILPNGDWSHVYYVCHDPAVIIKHSENLAEFIYHVHEFGSTPERSNLNIIHEQTIMDIWQTNQGLIAVNEAAQSTDNLLRDFAQSFTNNFQIADLRNKPNRSGFAWGKFCVNLESAKRHPTELLWAIEKNAPKSFFKRLFGH